jgi:hypothetical protein
MLSICLSRHMSAALAPYITLRPQLSLLLLLLLQVGVLIQALRQAVSALLAAKVQDPSLDLAGQKVVQALHSLLATDGF